MDPVLEAVNIKTSFPVRGGLLLRPTAWVKAVDGVSLQLCPGQTLGLVGESGCGKSTLGRTLMRLHEPTAGDIRLYGKSILNLSGRALRRVRRQVQMVFQDPYSSLDPRQTIAAIVGEPLRVHGYDGDRRQRIQELMALVGMNPEHLDRYPHEFSGGQRQRIGIARAIALEPDVLIADEPVSALDVSIQAQILNLLHDLQRRLGLALLFISHDLSVVEHMCDEIAVMYLGRIVERAPCRRLFHHPAHPYTRMLLAAVPQLGRGKRRHQVAVGEVPSAVDPPPGCPFHPRCSLAEDRCRRERPELEAFPDQPLQEAACWVAHQS